GLAIDVAGEGELAQVFARDGAAVDIVVTAAVKPRALLEMCVRSGVTVVIDNEDELGLLRDVAEDERRELPVAFRLASESLASTRFGLAPAEIVALVDRYWPATRLVIHGLHFHLDGYEADDRVAALAESFDLIDSLRERGHRMQFVDI